MSIDSSNIRVSAAESERIDWQWDDTVASENKDGVVLSAEDGSRFVFTRNDHKRLIALQRVRSSGDTVWVQPIPSMIENAAALLLHATKLYVALYSDIATGCRVLALDAASGKLLWEVQLKGLGPIHHSKYRNCVQLRFIENWLVIFGNEAGGKYIEVLEPDSGSLLSNHVVRP